MRQIIDLQELFFPTVLLFFSEHKFWDGGVGLEVRDSRQKPSQLLAGDVIGIQVNLRLDLASNADLAGPLLDKEELVRLRWRERE